METDAEELHGTGVPDGRMATIRRAGESLRTAMERLPVNDDRRAAMSLLDEALFRAERSHGSPEPEPS